MRFPKRKHSFLYFKPLFTLTILVTLNIVPNTTQGQNPAQIAFKSNNPIITQKGAVTLSWTKSNKNNTIYELQQARDPNFHSPKQIYKGPDLGSFLSGLKEGSYYYRIRTVDKDTAKYGPWAEPVTVKVEYQSMTLAWSLFSVGAFIFISIVIVVLKGANKEETV